MEPLNIIMGVVAIIGGVLIMVNQGSYGLIFLIIATLIEAVERAIK
jgi:hypothetical protein